MSARSLTSLRSCQGLSFTKRNPVFGASEPVRRLNPVTVVALSTAGLAWRILSTFWSVASVRSSDAASGSWQLTMK